MVQIGLQRPTVWTYFWHIWCENYGKWLVAGVSVLKFGRS